MIIYIHYICDHYIEHLNVPVCTCHQWSSSPWGFLAVTPVLNHRFPLVSKAHTVLFSPRAIQMGSRPWLSLWTHICNLSMLSGSNRSYRSHSYLHDLVNTNISSSHCFMTVVLHFWTVTQNVLIYKETMLHAKNKIQLTI